ncbi:MAG: O-antigen ligase family protein [Cyanobacteria bacterium NC_groundwater_1444_Ag_S-0.65um_54_12]|nr:O-antigen ligase family protein [Cyanobacteria bacterium NC_groundwater_1444_Ag_S-0.65um_54_12]
MPTPAVAHRILLGALWLLPVSAALSAVMILFAAIALLPWYWRQARTPVLSIDRRWLWLLLLIALSTIFSEQPAASWPGFLLVSANLLTIWVVAQAHDRPDFLKKSMKAIFWGIVPWAIIGMAIALLRLEGGWQWSLVQLHLGFPDNRVNSIFFHPNLFSGYLLLALASGLGLAQERWHHYAPALAILVLCQVMTQSRSGWIGTAVMLALTFLGSRFALGPRDRPALSNRRDPAREFFQALLCGRWKFSAALLATGVLLAMIFPRLLTIFDLQHPSNLGRLRVWDSAWAMIKAKPLLGWGPGSWNMVYPHYRNPDEFEHLPHAHSLYLQLGAEYGLLVLAVLLWSLGGAIGSTIRCANAYSTWYRIAVPLSAALIGYLVMGLFEFTISEGRNGILFFTTVGFLLALRRFAAKHPDC